MYLSYKDDVFFFNQYGSIDVPYFVAGSSFSTKIQVLALDLDTVGKMLQLDGFLNSFQPSYEQPLDPKSLLLLTGVKEIILMCRPLAKQSKADKFQMLYGHGGRFFEQSSICWLCNYTDFPRCYSAMRVLLAWQQKIANDPALATLKSIKISFASGH